MSNESELAVRLARIAQAEAADTVRPVAQATGTDTVLSVTGDRCALTNAGPNFRIVGGLAVVPSDLVVFSRRGTERLVIAVIGRNALDVATGGGGGGGSGAAGDVTIVDAGGHFTATNVETALAELFGDLAGYQPLSSDLTAIDLLTTTTYGRAFLALVNQAALMALLDFGEAGDISTQAFGDAAAAGSSGEVADAGHKHAMPAAAITSSGHTMATARLLGRTTASTGALEELTAAAVKAFLAIATGDVSGLGTVATLASDTDTTLAANSDSRVATQKATKAYVDGAVTGLLEFKGTTDCSANPNYPAALKGDAYVVSVAGKIGGGSGKAVAIGDWYVATADNAGGTEASVGTSWAAFEHNIADLATVATTGSASDLGTGTLPAGRFPALTGDVTTVAGALAATIAARAVTYAKMQAIAQGVILGRAAGAGSGDMTELSVAQVKAILALVQADIAGLTTSDLPQFAGINLGHATDTTLTRVAPARAALEGKEIDTWDGVIVKGSNESVTSSTAVQNDDDFAVAFTNGKVYFVEFLLAIDGSAAGDIKMDFGEDGTIRGSFSLMRLTTADVAANNAVEAQQGTTIGAGTAATPRGVYIFGTYTSAGGTFRLRWAQNVSDATATRILAGSLMRYRQIN